MLILTREENEAVILTVDGVNGPIEIAVSVASIGANSVKLGFEAPMDVVIDRREVHERKQADSVQA